MSYAEHHQQTQFNFDKFLNNNIKSLNNKHFVPLGSDHKLHGQKMESIAGVMVTNQQDLDETLESQILYIQDPSDTSPETGIAAKIYEIRANQTPYSTSFFVYGIPKLIKSMSNMDQQCYQLGIKMSEIMTYIRKLAKKIQNKTSLHPRIVNMLEITTFIILSPIIVILVILIYIFRIIAFNIMNAALNTTLYI